MIEKIIHYCWFGNQEKDATIINCIDSWKKHLPDYKIIEWNESNSHFTGVFSQQALKHKKWAFLSDYVRLKVLYEYGGIYMDTDMLVIKPFDFLLQHKCFLGYQSNSQINGSIIGCVKGNNFIKACFDRYESMEFDEMRLMSMAIPVIITDVFEKFPVKHDVEIYPYTYFYPYLFEESLTGKNYLETVKPETYAIHLWNASWFTEKELAGFAFEKQEWLKGIKLFTAYIAKNPKQILHIPAILIRKIFSRI